MSPSQTIDFVIPWVDGSDPAWQAEFYRTCVTEDSDGRVCRYRDWDLLRYWFRGVEKYTPWVNQIHFITWGHLPAWLNTAHPKLHVVKHTDYIPKEYLPTFSSHTIELNMHRIEGLSQRFVYFNDDTFLLRSLPPEAFFDQGLPCDSAILSPIYTGYLADGNEDGRIFYFSYNDLQYLNRQYNKRQCVRSAPLKWFNPHYGINLLRNILLSPWPNFVGIVDTHLPQPFLKSSFDKAWQDAADILHETCSHPVRTDHDVNQWFVRYRQLAEGCFTPRKPLLGASFCIRPENQSMEEYIRTQKKAMICINDTSLPKECVEAAKRGLQAAFDSILPEKSSFERIS